ncbi:MAG: hypothetical protein KDC46_09970 [Thermoleophilia bacterium]|nr:hypothetical protein [Thermoleophilia bacterium]
MHARRDPDMLTDALLSRRFEDGFDAGEQLADALRQTLDTLGMSTDDILVAGVTEGGMPLAYVVSMELDVDVEPAPVEPLHAPHARSVRIGMLVDDGTAYVDERLGDRHGARGSTLDHLIDRAEQRLHAQMDSIGDEPGAALDERTVVIVDDIVDSGTTAVAVTDWLRRWGARTVVVAAAVGTRQGMERARGAADAALCLLEVEDDIPPRSAFRIDPSRATIDMPRIMDAIRVGNEDRARRRSVAAAVQVE